MLLVLVVAFDADAKHFIDGHSEAIEGGAREGAVVV